MAKYKVYEARPYESCYDGMILFGAKDANDANACIAQFNAEQSKEVGYTIFKVDECDALESIYTHKPGLILTETIYTGY